MSRALKVAFSCLLGIAIVGAFLYGTYRRDLERETARVATGSDIAQTRCGPIEYASLGNGPAVLLVHGAGGGFDQLRDMAQELAGAGFRAVTMSRFGYLRTPLPADASPAAQADAHACLLDALNLDRAAVVGLSAGGPSALQFALRHAERTSALVLLVALAYAPQAPVAAPSAIRRFMIERAVKSDFLFWAAMRASPGIVVGSILGTPPEVVATASIEEQRRIQDVMRHILPLSRRQEGLLNDARVASSLTRYELEKISVRTLIVSLADDRYGTYASARYTAEHIPNARFLGYPTGGHLAVGRNAQIMAEVRAFLAGQPVLGMAK